MEKGYTLKILDGFAEVQEGIDGLRENRDDWARRAEKAEAAILSLFDLCNRMEFQDPDQSLPDFEDPMPILGVAAMIRNFLRLHGYRTAED